MAKACRVCGESLLKERLYRVQVRINGKWVIKQVPSLDEARQIELDLKKLRTVPEAERQGTITFNELWTHFYNYVSNRIKHPDKYNRDWRVHLRDRFGKRKLDEITPQDVLKLHQYLNERRVPLTHNSKMKERKNLKPATICHVLKLFRRLYTFSYRMGLYKGKNPTLHMELPKFDNRMTNTMNEEQVKDFIILLDSWKLKLVGLSFKMCLVTGKRVGEIFGLRWSDVDFHQNTISFLVKSLKVGERQVLPMSKTVREILELAKTHRLTDSEYVFHSRTGNKIDYSAHWKEIKSAAKLPKNFRPHDLRHTFASILASSGEVDIFTLQKFLGHKTTQMTNRYTHLLDSSLKKGTETIDRVFG